MAIAVSAGSSVADTCAAAKRAARSLAQLDTAVKDAALEAIALALEARMDDVLAANERDMQAGREADIGEALLDRLRLDAGRVNAIARAVRQIAALADPVGEVIDGRRLPNGLDVRKVRVPLGVIAVIYEARPNVTIDAAALCLKSGNAIVLRGSSSAAHSNAVLAAVAAEAAVAAGMPEGCVSLVAGGRRSPDGGPPPQPDGHPLGGALPSARPAGRQAGDDLAELATQNGTVDLIIPRGGEGLKRALQAVATVPVIYAASGNCHVYVDASADLEQARAIVLNAKTQRPGVCNAAETLLVHARAADAFLPGMLTALASAGVSIRADARAHDAIARHNATPHLIIEEADEQDWATEYLAPVLAVGIVDSVEEAIEHIARYGSGHSEAILTRDTAAARAFQLGVDAACVYVNASTRFTDGGEFGMGAEIGNSTQKLHARGPIGLRELCTFKYLIEGDGHVRA